MSCNTIEAIRIPNTNQNQNQKLELIDRQCSIVLKSNAGLVNVDIIDIEAATDAVLFSLQLNDSECIINGGIIISGLSRNDKKSEDFQKWNTFWITIDMHYGFYAVGTSKKVGHKIVCCNRLPLPLSLPLPTTNGQLKMKTNNNWEAVEFNSFQQYKPKFDGCNLRNIYGLTIVSHVNKKSQLMIYLNDILTMIKKSPISHYYGYLPAESLHMTVMSVGVYSEVETNAKKYVVKKALSCLENYRDLNEYSMVAVDVNKNNGFSIILQPNDTMVHMSLSDYREKVNQLVPEARYDSQYIYHITLCYGVFPLKGVNITHADQLRQNIMNRFPFLFKQTNQESPNNQTTPATPATPQYMIDFQCPELCHFESMGDFVPY